MIRRISLAVGLVALIASCGASQPSPPPERPGVDVDYPLNNVTSVCDRFGHRVYRFHSRGDAGGIAVIPNDPTCISRGSS